MRVVVCGAGQVGTSIARQLAMENNDVVMIDQSPKLIQRVSETLDVKAHVGFASHPTMLEDVGAADADMIIAVTQSDEVNMITCQVAHSLFDVPTKIARVRNQNYLQPRWRHLYRHDHLPIDYIISPEIEVANAIIHRLHVPGAVDTIPLSDGSVKAIGVRATLDCPTINMSLSRIQSKFKSLKVSIVGLMRDNTFLMADEDTELLVDDELYFVCDSNDVQKAMAILGHEEREARRLVIMGGGNIGLFLAEYMEKNEPDVRMKLIELGKDRAEYVAEHLSNTTVINGNALTHTILREANVAVTETLIAVSNDDEANILCSLLAKRLGCQRVVALVNNSASYSSLISSLGIDVAVNPREITVSTILQHIRRGRILSVHSICKGKVEVIEVVAVEASPVAGKALGHLALPSGITVGSIVRDGEVIIPNEDTIVNAGDHLTVISQADMVKKAERIFSVKFEFF